MATLDIRRLASDPAQFRRHLAIDAGGRSIRLGDVIEPWQSEDYQALDPAWRAVASSMTAATGRVRVRAWLERPRGHSKTSDLAVMVTWALFASRHALRGYCAAADQDQAGLLRDVIVRLSQLNPWLSKVFEFRTAKIVNKHTGSVLEILTSDSATSYGLTPHFVVCDELTHWKSPDLWDSLLSASAKRENCLLITITNAGRRHSWQWRIREAVRTDPGWYFHALDGPQASWITPARLDEQRRLLPDIAYRRLWLNQWTSGSGDLLTEDDLAAALGLWTPAPAGRQVYVGGLDLGLKHDRTAFAIVGKDQHAHLRVHTIDTWRAPQDGKVDLAVIERHILDTHRQLRLHHVAADPWQASYLLDRLRKLGVPCRERPQVGKQLNEQAAELVRLLQSRQLAIPDDEGLLYDLRNASITEKSYGLRIDSPRDERGHGDVLSALQIAVAELKGLRASARNFAPPDAGMYAERLAEAERKMQAALGRASEQYGHPVCPDRHVDEPATHWARQVFGM